MEKSPSGERNSSSAGQEILRVSLGFLSPLSVEPLHIPLCWVQISRVHALPLLFLEDYFMIILPSSPRSSKHFLFFRFPQRNTILISPFPHFASLQRILYTKHTQFSTGSL
jgi:hypothetical protein